MNKYDWIAASVLFVSVLGAAVFFDNARLLWWWLLVLLLF